MSDLESSRDRMITEQLATRGITDARVIEAMRSVPRERFIDADHACEAYEDRSLPLAPGQTMSQPHTVALMAQAAEIQPVDRVLEVGAGSGYGAAVLGRLAARVWAIERQPQLARRAGGVIATLGFANVTILRGDGSLGWPPAAPFNAILVTAVAPETPEALRRQLAIGGRLVLPVGEKEGPQRLIKIIRVDASTYKQEDLGPVAFAPLIGEQGFADA